MIAIVGAGAIGRLWASSFEPHSASFLSTREHDATSISFDLVSNSDSAFDTQPSPEKRFAFKQYQVTELSSANLTPTCIWICTKSTAALEACTRLDKHLPNHTPFVLMQNGLGSQQQILSQLTKRPLFAAVTTHGANIPSENKLVHAGHGHTNIGALNELAKTQNPTLNLDGAISNSAFDIHHSTDIWQALWKKLIVNCAINPFTALFNVPNGQIASHSLFEKLWPQLRAELCDLSSVADYAMTEPEIEEHVFHVMHSTQENISSMLQDVRAGRKTEIEDINGYACKVLASANKKQSANRELWEQVNALRN